MDELLCQQHFLNFTRRDDNAILNVPLANDNMPECEKKFTASLILEKGFRRGLTPSASITVIDDGNVDSLQQSYCMQC